MSNPRFTVQAPDPPASPTAKSEPDRAALKQRLVAFWNTQQLYWDGMTDEVSAKSPLRARAAAFVPEGSRILDVACGSAANALWLTRRGTYFGSDISVGGLRRVQQPSLKLACADAEALPFADAAFDAVISTFALEHSVNPVQMLAEMRRVAKPGGRIILLGPNWDLPFWYPNALQSRVTRRGWRRAYTLRRLLGQLRGLLTGHLPFFIVDDPDAFHRDFVHDADAVYVVWTYEVVRQMKRWSCSLLHAEVDDRMLGTRTVVRWMKQALYRLPFYRYAGSTVLLVFAR